MKMTNSETTAKILRAIAKTLEDVNTDKFLVKTIENMRVMLNEQQNKTRP